MDSLKKKIPMILLAAVLLADLAFLLRSGWMVDSDMAQEMLLADHLNSTGTLISENWVYTTEIRVLNTHCFFRLGLLLFPHNWHYARIFGAFCVYALLLVGLYLFMKETGHGRHWAAAGIFLLLPVSTMYWFLGLFGLCYVFYGSCILLMMYAVLRGKRMDAVFASACILSLLLGMNGVKMLLLFYAPLAAVSVLHMLMKKNTGAVFTGMSLSFAGFLGVVINNVCFRSYRFTDYGATSLAGSQWSADLDFSAFADKLLDFLTLFGYQGGVKLASVYGIAALLSFLPAGYAVWILARAVRTHSVTDEKTGFAEAVLMMMLITDAAAFTLLNANYNSSYWIPAFIFAAALIVIRTGISFNEKQASRILAVGIAAGCFCAFAVLKRNTASPLRARPGLDEAARWLADNGCTQGYAQFWDADAAVEMTSGRLDIYAVESMKDTGKLSWGQSLDHFRETPQSEVFLLIRKGEPQPDLAGSSPVYENEEYLVYIRE